MVQISAGGCQSNSPLIMNVAPLGIIRERSSDQRRFDIEVRPSRRLYQMYLLGHSRVTWSRKRTISGLPPAQQPAYYKFSGVPMAPPDHQGAGVLEISTHCSTCFSLDHSPEIHCPSTQ